MKQAQGGVGDFLQIIDESKEIGARVISHFSKAKEFFSSLGVRAEVYLPGDVQTKEELENFEYKLYQDFELPEQKEIPSWINDNSFFGIHPVGSSFSNSLYSEKGLPKKIMPVSFVKEVINSFPDEEFVIFGTKNELDVYEESINKKNVHFYSPESIWDSFHLVHKCKTILAVDRSIKSYAAIRKIHSYVMIGDYEDKIRDEKFIDPYSKDGVITPIRFKKMNRKKAKEVVEIIKNV